MTASTDARSGAAEEADAHARARAGPAPAPSCTRLWPAVLERVGEGEGGEMLAALLADARPVALEEDVLVLAYPASASFSKRKIEDRANGERLGRALRAGRRAPATPCVSS